MKKGFINLGLILLIFFLAINNNWRVKDKFLELKYTFFNTDEEIHSYQKIEKILSGFEKLSYTDLEEEYLENTKSNETKYKKLVQNLDYCRIKKSDLNKRIVGRFRIKDFICKDAYYKKCLGINGKEVICTFNKKIFFKTLELLQELESLGHDPNAFDIVNGHRHPKYNEAIGGAKLSRHIKGEAVDIVVYDINKDGRSNKKDKDIILDLLDKKIIKSEGGIGLYPGTDRVHYYVRGKRARWNSY